MGSNLYHISVKKQVSICYLTFDSLREGVGQSQIVPLLQGLNDEGFKISLISFEKNVDCDFKPFLDHPDIIWEQVPFGARGVLGLPLRILRMCKSLPKADIYHSRSDLPTIVLMFRRKKRFLWDVRSLWFEQKAIVEDRKLSGISYWLSRKIEKYASSHAKAINVLASTLLPVLEERNGILPKIQTIIPTSVDLNRFKFVRELSDKKVILLSGSMNNFYDIDFTLELLDYFHESGFSVQWNRSFESPKENLARRYIKVVNSSHHEMPEAIGLCTVGVAICRDNAGISLKGVMPTKIAEFLAVGRPVMVSSGMGDLDSLIQSTKTGVIVSRNMELEQIYNQVIELIEDKGTPDRCRKLAEKNFSMKGAIQIYKKTYQKMLAEN